uniref:Uncharacterized protein n=1 Tax=Zea mays TaxID=4577 RepID=B8A332_MAIZE|nr:unknown [Zea mays]
MKPLVARLLLCYSLLCLAPAAAPLRLQHDHVRGHGHGHAHPPPYARNATAYGVSAALCPGCGAWADALEFLYYHNLVRLASLEPPLAWSPRLASYAGWWAPTTRTPTTRARQAGSARTTPRSCGDAPPPSAAPGWRATAAGCSSPATTTRPATSSARGRTN